MPDPSEEVVVKICDYVEYQERHAPSTEHNGIVDGKLGCALVKK